MGSTEAGGGKVRETQLKSLDGVCMFRVADLQNQLLELHEQRSDWSSAISLASTTPETSPQSPEILHLVHPTGVREGGEINLPRPAAVHPPDVSRPSSPDVAGMRDFCKTDVQAWSSPIPDVLIRTNDLRNTSMASSSGEATMLRKILIRKMEALEKIVGQPVDNGTEMERLKNLHDRVIPRVEKMVHDIESDLQKYSRVANLMELEEVFDQVDPIVEEASNFVATITSLYDDNEGYAPTLSRLEKVMAEIKGFSAGSDVMDLKFLDKFNTYCTGSKKGKAYKLYNNYLSGSIQAQTNSLQQDFEGLVNFLKTNYERIEVISNGLLSELEWKKQPGDNDSVGRAESLLAIQNTI